MIMFRYSELRYYAFLGFHFLSHFCSETDVIYEALSIYGFFRSSVGYRKVAGSLGVLAGLVDGGEVRIVGFEVILREHPKR